MGARWKRSLGGRLRARERRVQVVVLTHRRECIARAARQSSLWSIKLTEKRPPPRSFDVLHSSSSALTASASSAISFRHFAHLPRKAASGESLVALCEKEFTVGVEKSSLQLQEQSKPEVTSSLTRMQGECVTFTLSYAPAQLLQHPFEVDESGGVLAQHSALSSHGDLVYACCHHA